MTTKNQKTTASVALMAVFTLGICLIIMGSISVELMTALDINGGQFGTLIMVLYVTSCLVQLFIGPLVDKFGHKPFAIIGFITTSLSMFILAFASNFSLALFASAIMGIGAMACNTVGNTLIPIVLFEGKDPVRASNFGTAFFGLGYVITPLLVVFIIKSMNLSYSIALIIIGALALVFSVITIRTDLPRVETGYKLSTALKVLFKPPVLIAALALFCYTSLESTMGTWIKKLMEELFGGNLNVDASTKAGLVLSLFGLSMTLGRFLFSTIKNLTAMGAKVISIMAIVSVLAIILMIVSKGPILGIFAVILVGFAFAPIFPTIIGVTFAKYDKSLYGSIFGIVFAVGLLGGTFLPKFIGNFSVGSSLQQSLSIAAIMAGILFAISLVIDRIGRKNAN